MCGLCGIAGNIGTEDFKAFQTLLFLSELRGSDATGLIGVEPLSAKQIKKGVDLTIKTTKQAVPASYFIHYVDPKGMKKQIFDNAAHSSVLMGHTRSGTIGAKEDVKNAHPFSFDKLIGMHNGTIYKKFKHTETYPTDSEALYRNINDDGISVALNEVESASTAYALTWLHKKERTLNFIRNDKRPLWLALCNNATILAWASEDWMLREVIKRQWPTETPVIWQPKVNVLHKYDLTNTYDFWKHPISEQIEVKYTPVVYNSGTYKSGSAMGFEYWEQAESDFEKDQLGTANATKKAIVPVLPRRSDVRPAGSRSFFKVPFGVGAEWNRTRFQSIMEQGCGLCGTDGDINDPLIDLKIAWVNQDAFICESCQQRDFCAHNMQWTKVLAPSVG